MNVFLKSILKVGYRENWEKIDYKEQKLNFETWHAVLLVMICSKK